MLAKIRVIKTIAHGTVGHGLEMIGMGDNRRNKVQRLIDEAIGWMIENSNYSRHRVYQELGIERMNVRAARMRTRAIITWKKSRTTIGSIVDTSCKCRKKTWVTGTRWLNKYAKEVELTARRHKPR